MNYLVLVGIAVVGIVLWIVGTMGKKKEDKKRIDISSSNPYEQVRIEESLNNELRELILKGEEIKAIKEYRVATGVGLKEAKDYVTNLKNNI